MKPFADQVRSGYVYDAGKPGTRGYLEAMKKMGISAAETLFVGDQIFTDIWGANRAGMDTILTNPVDRSTDEIQIVVKRFWKNLFGRSAEREAEHEEEKIDSLDAACNYVLYVYLLEDVPDVQGMRRKRRRPQLNRKKMRNRQSAPGMSNPPDRRKAKHKRRRRR